MEVHANSATPELHALRLQPQALFPTLLAKQGDPTPGTHYAVPRQSDSPLQRPDGQARCPRESSGFGHLAVRNHLPSRHSGNYCTKKSK